MFPVYISVEHPLEPKGSPIVFDSIITGPAEEIICHTPGTVHDYCSHYIPLKMLLIESVPPDAAVAPLCM